MDKATDDTDEVANLAEVKTEIVHVDEDNVFERGTGRGRLADEEWGPGMQTFYSLVQDVTHLVTILVVGFRAARAAARTVHRLTPEGPTTEYVKFEDLMNEEWTGTASGEIGLVAGAYFFPRRIACGLKVLRLERL